MPAINTGSIALNILNRIVPMPAGISGGMIQIANEQVYLAEQVTGQSIGLTAIAEQYQSALTDMTTSQVLKLMAVQDLGVQNVSVGDLTTDNKNLFEMAKMMESRGMQSLQWLTKGIKFNKTYG